MSATEKFEAHAEAFYREKGYMAPGKDRSAAMSDTARAQGRP